MVSCIIVGFIIFLGLFYKDLLRGLLELCGISGGEAETCVFMCWG